MSEGHKLDCQWKFWYSPRGKNANHAQYEANLKPLSTINTVEDFLSCYCYLKRPSNIEQDHKIMFFRNGCRPMWEDWKTGGTWIILMRKEEYELLNKRWEQLLFACIGEQFDDKRVIGVVLSIRNQKALLEIWIRERDAKLQQKVAEALRNILQLDPEKLNFYFKDHDKSLTEKSTLKGAENFTFIRTPLETPMTPLIEQHNFTKKDKEELDDLKI